MSSFATPDVNLGPLTTPFVVPTECQSITFASPSSISSLLTPIMYTAPSCYPSGKPLGSAYTSTTLIPYQYHDEHLFYSPGVCPTKWVSEYIGTGGSGGKETSAACCQPGFTILRNGIAGTASGMAANSVWRCVTELKTTAVPTETGVVKRVVRRAAEQPACAVPCLQSAIAAAGCGQADIACQCGTGQAAIQTAETPCLLANCGPIEIQSAALYGAAICSSFSLTATAPKTTIIPSPTASSAVQSSKATSVIVTMTPPSSPASSGSTTLAVTKQATVVQATSTYTFTIYADPVFIRYQDGDFVAAVSNSSSSSPSNTTGSSNTTSGGPLSVGAKIGLGVTIPLVLLLIATLVGCRFVRRKGRRKETAVAQVHSEDVSPLEFKAELHDPETRFVGGRVKGPVVVKSELFTPSKEEGVTEIRHRDVPELAVTDRSRDTVIELVEPELDATPAAVHSHAELGTSPIPSPHLITPVPVVRRKESNTGPLTTPEEFAIMMPVLGGNGKSDMDKEDEELEYQARRLRERREILAEKEKLAREEEDLRRLMRERGKKGGGSAVVEDSGN